MLLYKVFVILNHFFKTTFPSVLCTHNMYAYFYRLTVCVLTVQRILHLYLKNMTEDNESILELITKNTMKKISL